MKTCVLFSGGKDSTLALDYALRFSEVECLVSIASKNPESFMFHTPNMKFVSAQAESMDLPLIMRETEGVKEEELHDLEKALREVKGKFSVEGVVTGALASAYQASRIQKICSKLKLECFNPLWQKNQWELLQELQERKIKAVVAAAFAPGLKEFLGKPIDGKFISGIKKIAEKTGINPAGEGGEFESFTLDAPFFRKRLEIARSRIVVKGREAAVLEIQELKGVEK